MPLLLRRYLGCRTAAAGLGLILVIQELPSGSIFLGEWCDFERHYSTVSVLVTGSQRLRWNI